MRDADRILIVEDEKILAADLEKKLHGLGYRIDSIASSGEEAVRLAQERLPNLVLMDVRLSGTMDCLFGSFSPQSIVHAGPRFVCS
jgi:CheY-like chemotaxis protein